MKAKILLALAAKAPQDGQGCDPRECERSEERFLPFGRSDIVGSSAALRTALREISRAVRFAKLRNLDFVNKLHRGDIDV